MQNTANSGKYGLTEEITKCPRCGGRYVNQSFMVGVGDEVEWDNDQFCLDCDGKVETNIEFGMVTPEENQKLSIIH